MIALSALSESKPDMWYTLRTAPALAGAAVALAAGALASGATLGNGVDTRGVLPTLTGVVTPFPAIPTGIVFITLALTLRVVGTTLGVTFTLWGTLVFSLWGSFVLALWASLGLPSFGISFPLAFGIALDSVDVHGG